MFADSMLETSWAQRSRRSWSTMTSFGLQAFIVGFLLLLPLVRPVALPFLRPLPTPLMLAVPPGPPPAVAHSTPRPAESNMFQGRILVPPSIPIHVRVFEEVIAPQVGIGDSSVVGSTGERTGVPNGILGAIGNPATALPAEPPPPTKPQIVRVSHMSEGDLIRKVQPVYPPLARTARIQGQVILAAIISKEGTIENLRVLQGHPLLIAAAIDAVRQWRYRPYILNQEPIAVETQVTVNFSLSGN